MVFIPERKGNKQARVDAEYLELGNILGQLKPPKIPKSFLETYPIIPVFCFFFVG